MKIVLQSISIIVIGCLSIFAVADYTELLMQSSTSDQEIQTEVWTTIDPADNQYPTSRHETSFVMAGEHFYLLGGRGRDSVNVYDPVAQTWTERSQIPVEMHHFQAVELDGLIYIAGAFTGNCCDEPPLPIVYIYDPFDDQWIDGPTIPAERRRGSSGAIVYNDEIYLISGLQVGHQSGWVEWVDKYNPATNRWIQLPDAPRARDHFHAGLVDDKIVVAGGRNSGRSGIFGYTIGEVDIYDISDGSWSTATDPLPSERAGTTAAVLGEEVLVIGGESSRTAAFDTTEAFNIFTGDWRTLGALNRARHGIQAIVHDDVVYVAAGSGSRGGSPELDTLEAFNYTAPPSAVGQPLVESRLAPRGAAVDFGERLVESESVQELILTNEDGNQAIIMTDIQLDDTTVFAYSFPYTLPVAVAPGESAIIALGFRPNEAQEYATQLTISHSGKDGSTIVPVLGSGTGSPPANQSPVVAQPIEDLNVDEDSSPSTVDLSLFFSDPDQSATSLDYTINTSGVPAVLLATVAGPSLSLLPLPNANGTVTVAITATDDEGLSVTDTFVVTVNPVNDPPYITPNDDLEMREGEVLNVDIMAGDPDNDPLDFDVSIKPNMDIATFVLNKNNKGVLRFKPDFDDAGQHTVTVTVRDPDQLSAVHAFTIDVADRNSTPTISELPSLALNVGQRITMTVTSTDRDGDAVTIRIPDRPDFIELTDTQLDTNGYLANLIIAPTEDDIGAHVIPVQAVDPAGLFAESVLSVTVESGVQANRPPAISKVDDLTVTAGIPFTIGLSVVDADLGVNLDEFLTATIESGPSGSPLGVTLDDSRLNQENILFLQWNGAASAGSYPVTISVADVGGLTDETSFVITVQPADESLPPQPVSGVSSPELRSGEPYSLTVQFVDPNADQVTLRAVDVPIGARFTDLGDGIGLFEWQPNDESLGQHTFVVSATDSTGLSTEQQYSLLVTPNVPQDVIDRLFFPAYQ